MEDRQFELEDLLDDPAGVAELTELASSGDLDAMYVLGLAYYDGDSVEQSSTQCIELLEKAARGGHVGAIHDLGCMHYYGYRLPPEFLDRREAARLLELSASKGHVPSITFLASMYENGEGVMRDLSRASSLYEQAAKLGDDTGRQGLDRLHGA